MAAKDRLRIDLSRSQADQAIQALLKSGSDLDLKVARRIETEVATQPTYTQPVGYIVEDYSPTTFGETKNTLTCYQMGGLQARNINITPGEIGEFQAERLLEAGYVIFYDKERANWILENRKI